MPNLIEYLDESRNLTVHQRHELGELFGFETRNKYEIKSDRDEVIGFAAEQQKGFLGFILRQFLGHWRRFNLTFFDQHRKPLFVAEHPFRFFFQRIEVRKADGSPVGALQQRFSILSKRFDVEGPRGEVYFQMVSPLWRLWTFRFLKNDQEVAKVEKKWSGLFSEVLTDKDNFLVSFGRHPFDQNQKILIVASSVFIDLQYFEKKAN